MSEQANIQEELTQVEVLDANLVVGPTGPANSLSIGTVTTGAAGSSASATITGTAPTQTLSLTIPRGDTGATGATGATGPQGPAGDPASAHQTYTHNQNAPSSTWTINHNLSAYPAVTIVDSAGNVVFGEVNYLSNNALTVTFSGSFSGQAFLN